MADIGTTEGIFTGLGQAMGNIGQAIAKRREGQVAERDALADNYEKQAREISQNLNQALGGRPLHTVLQDKNAEDWSQINDLYGELSKTVQLHNALYPMHETPALVARIQKMFGRQPAAPTQDPRAAMTAEQQLAAAPAQVNDQQVRYRQIYNLLKTNHPDWTPDQVATRTEDFMFPQRARTPRLKTFINDQGEVEDVDVLTLEDIKDAKNRGFHEMAPGEKYTAMADIDAAADAWADPDYGLVPPIAIRSKVFARMKARGLKAAPPPAKPRFGWVVYNGQPASVKLDANNQPVPGTLNLAAIPPGALLPKEGTMKFVSPDGNLMVVPYTTSPMLGGIPSYTLPATTTPTTPSISGVPQGTPQATPQQRPQPTPTQRTGQRGGVQVHAPQTVAFQGTPDQRKALTEHADAMKLLDIAHQAQKTKGAVQDKALAQMLVTNMNKRFNDQSVKELLSTNVSDNFEVWMNTTFGKGELPPELRDQLVKVVETLVRGSEAKLRAMKVPDNVWQQQLSAEEQKLLLPGR